MHAAWWTLGLQTVNFGILVWILHRFLYKPVLAMIDARKAEVDRQLEAAKAIGEKAKAELAAADAARTGIASERDAALKAAASQAHELAESRRAQAAREAEALIDASRKTLAEERKSALDEARRLALDLGADFAQRLLAEVPMQYRAEAWIERIEQHLDTLPAPERDALAHQVGGGDKLTVITACPLPPATADQWRERLRRSLGDADVRFEVDRNLIAGAELHFPTAILRFSWQSALQAARNEVCAHAGPR